MSRLLTVTEARKAYVATLTAEVGYVSGNYEWSKYGKSSAWRSPWLWGRTESQGYYCARFASWGMDQVFGMHGRLAIGGPQPQFPFPFGWAATWLWRDWLRANGRHQGGWAAAEPGDFVFYLLDGPRKANPTNHVGVFVRWADRPGGTAVTVEGNLPKPGHGNSTIGVWFHHRRLDHQVVAVYKPDFPAAVRAHNAALPKPEPTPVPEEDTLSEAFAEQPNLYGTAAEKFGPGKHTRDGLLAYAAMGGLAASSQIPSLQGQVAALTKAVEQMATAQGIDPEQITQAARAGVEEALRSVTADVTLTLEGPEE